jgi:hypothetical protein
LALPPVPLAFSQVRLHLRDVFYNESWPSDLRWKNSVGLDRETDPLASVPAAVTGHMTLEKRNFPFQLFPSSRRGRLLVGGNSD